MGEEYFVIWTQIAMCCEARSWYIFYILWNTKNYMMVENNPLVWFEYTDFDVLINVSLPASDVDKCALSTRGQNLITANIWSTYGPIALKCEEWYNSSDFYHYFSEVLILPHAVHHKMLSMTYRNRYVVMIYIEHWR